MKTYDVVILGAGIGGTAAAAVAAHAGLKTLLLEKNPRFGGSCASYERDGFKIDVGTHMFSRGGKGPLNEVCRRTGTEPIRFVKSVPAVHIKGLGADIQMPASPLLLPWFGVRFVRQLGIHPREWKGIANLFGALLKMDENEIEQWNGRSVDEFVRRYTDNPKLYLWFSFLLGLYFILPPKQVSAGEAIWSFQRMFKDNDLSYPMGGASVIPETYVNICRRHGGEARVKAGVKRIELIGGRAARVHLDSGESIDTRAVVSTTSLRDTVERLVGREHFPSAFAGQVSKTRGSLIAVQVKLGLPKKWTRAGCIVGGLPLQFKPHELTFESFDRMFTSVQGGMIPDVTMMYAPVASNIDPSLAPPGHQIITACSVAPTTDIALVDGEDKWIASLEKILETFYPGIFKDALFVDRFGVRYMETWLGKTGASAVTTGQTPGQVGKARVSVRSPVQGLYFAGDCAGARGVGTELAAASGMACVDALLADSALLGFARPAGKTA